VFFIRAIDSRRYIKIKMQPARLAFILGLLLVQIWLGLTAPKLWPLWETLILLVLGLSGFGYIMLLVRRLARKVRWRRG
jgi:hypothetical protein